MKRGKMEMTEEDSYGQTILDPTQDDESFGAIYYDRSHYTSTECTTSPPPSRVHNSSRNSGGSSTPSSSSTPESHWDRLERQKTALLSDISSSKDKATTVMFSDEHQIGVIEYDNYEEPTEKLTCSTILWMILCPACIGKIFNRSQMKEILESLITFSSFIIAIQLLLLIIMLSQDGIDSSFPIWGPSKDTLLEWGALNGDKVMHCAELYRIFSAMWINAGVTQFILNTFAILRVGLFVEYRWRWMRYALIYMMCGVSGGLLSLILQPNTVSVTSSTAMCGIVSAYLCEVIFTWYKTEWLQRLISSIICILFISLTLLLGLVDPYVDDSGTVGGAVMGLLLGCYYSLIESDFNPQIKVHLPNTILVVVTSYYVAGITVFYVLTPVQKKTTC